MVANANMRTASGANDNDTGLTPVHIRGKQKRKSPGTTPSMTAENAPTKMKRSLDSVRASRSSRHRHRPTLDSLPVELLESILLYSENLSFPRSNPLIGAKLSGKATKLRLFMTAFHDTWNQWFGIPKHEVYGPRQDLNNYFLCDGDASFQSTVLGLPWVDIDLILQAQQTWSDRYARDRWYQHCLTFKEGLHRPDDGHNGGYSHFNSRDCFEADYERALSWPAFEANPRFWGTVDVHPMTRIPMDLITGPWDDEMKRRLFWLIRGGLDIGSDDQISWELKVECLENVVVFEEKPDPLIVNCLINDWIFADLPEDVVQEQVANVDKRLEWGTDDYECREILSRVRRELVYNGSSPVYTEM